MTKRNFVSWLPVMFGALILPRVDRWLTDYFKLPEYAFFVTVISIAVFVGLFFLARKPKETGES
jgi:hypothetical protein